MKKTILDKICYTDPVFDRIRKKLGFQKTDKEIRSYIRELIDGCPAGNFVEKGKNYYIRNTDRGVQITINKNTTRVITVDRVK